MVMLTDYRYGLQANNAILAEESHLPLYQELIQNHPVQYTAGGSAQNTMRAAQWHLQPNSTVFVGCVGRDEYGARLCEVATKDGLQVEYLEDETAPTGTCACLITDGGKSRSLVANLGAANNYKIEHVKSARMEEILKGANCVYISGFFLTVSLETIMHVVKQAHERGQLMEALPYVDYLFGNETEALALAKSLKLESENATDIAMYVAKLPKHSCAKDARPERTVIITHGDLPTVVVTPTGIQTFPVEEIPTDELVDTNGAGDAFAGGFLSQLVQGKSLSASIQAGHYTAGVIIRRSGINFPPRPNMEFPDATTVSASS